MQKITKEMIEALRKPLPQEAISQHPTKKYLSTIKNIYVSERLNEVFGFGSWFLSGEVVENAEKMIVLKVTLSLPDYNLNFETFGGNDNPDRGDAYKGALSDGLTKIAAQYLEIGIDVFKGITAPVIATNSNPIQSTQQTKDKPVQAAKKPIFTEKDYADVKKALQSGRTAEQCKDYLTKFSVISDDWRKKLNELIYFTKHK